MLLLLGILIVTVSFVGVAFFALWLTNRSAGAAFTDRFQAAEFIIAHHQAPPAWLKHKGGFVWLMQDAAKLTRRNPASFTAGHAEGFPAEKVRLLKRLDGLIEFFETCPFFEDEETRAMVLAQLNQARTTWRAHHLEAIVGAPERESGAPVSIRAAHPPEGPPPHRPGRECAG